MRPHRTPGEPEHLASHRPPADPRLQPAGLVRHLMAERDWSQAKYYEQQGENQAAKFYYEQVAKNFDDTSFAEQVPVEIERVAELPPKPKQHAKWLIDMFPDREQAKPVIASNPTTQLR